MTSENRFLTSILNINFAEELQILKQNRIKNMQISDNVKQSYTEQYEDVDILEWRLMAAKYKAENIVKISEGLDFKNVLEVGCGEGSILFWLSKWSFSTNLHGIDISESGVEKTRSKNISNLKEVRLFDGYTIPYPDDSFDLVVCSHVMEHVEYERTLLREIKRVSKRQIFEVPIDFSFNVDKKVKHYLSYGHINIYTPALFRFLLFTENYSLIRDECTLYANEVLKHIYRDNRTSYFIVKIKHLIQKLFPFLLKIKPNSYVILTSKSDNNLSIF